MISDIVWRYDVNAKGEPVGAHISPVADRMLGLPIGTIGDSFDKYLSYVHPDDLPVVQKILSKGIRTLAKDLSTEYRLRKADGSTLWVRSRGSAYCQLDGGVTVFGTTSDIIEHRRGEEALKLEIVTQNIGAGLAIISKDYRTVHRHQYSGHCRGKGWPSSLRTIERSGLTTFSRRSSETLRASPAI